MVRVWSAVMVQAGPSKSQCHLPDRLESEAQMGDLPTPLGFNRHRQGAFFGQFCNGRVQHPPASLGEVLSGSFSGFP